MRLALWIVLAAFAAAAAHADTANTRKGVAQLEFKKPGAVDFRTQQASASGGATARSNAGDSEKDLLFQRLDLDGDGMVSKAEAAGNAPVTLGFDRADRNRDGKLSRAEYENLGKPPAKKATRQARNQGSASTGATAVKAKAKSKDE